MLAFRLSLFFHYENTPMYLCNFDPLKPYFYIVHIIVYIIFPICAQKHRLWVDLVEAVLTSTHNLCFEHK